MIDEAKRQYDEDDSLSKKNFVLYLQRTYVPEDKRIDLPDDSTMSQFDAKGGNRKYARWFTSKITAHIHPDKFKT